MGRTACTESQCLYKGALYLNLGSGHCDELITRTKEPYRLCVHPIVLYWNLKNEAA